MIDDLGHGSLTDEQKQEFIRKMWTTLHQVIKTLDPASPDFEFTEGKQGILIFYFGEDATRCRIFEMGDLNLAAIMEFAVKAFPDRVKLATIPANPNGNGTYIV